MFVNHDTLWASFVALMGVIFTIWKDRAVRKEQTRVEENNQTQLQLEQGRKTVLELVDIIKNTYGQLSNDQQTAHKSLLDTLDWYMRQCDSLRTQNDTYRSWAENCRCGAAKSVLMVQSTRPSTKDKKEGST